MDVDCVHLIEFTLVYSPFQVSHVVWGQLASSATIAVNSVGMIKTTRSPTWAPAGSPTPSEVLPTPRALCLRKCKCLILSDWRHTSLRLHHSLFGVNLSSVCQNISRVRYCSDLADSLVLLLIWIPYLHGIFFLINICTLFSLSSTSCASADVLVSTYNWLFLGLLAGVLRLSSPILPSESAWEFSSSRMARRSLLSSPGMVAWTTLRCVEWPWKSSWNNHAYHMPFSNWVFCILFRRMMKYW